MSLRERRKIRTLEAIRDAAARLFAERGFDATRTRDIAEAAGIATGTLFNYAPTKEAIVLLIWKERAQRAADEGLAAAANSTDPVAIVDAVFEPIFAFYAEDRDLGRIFLQNAVWLDPTDPETIALNAGFIQRIAVLLAPYAGADAMQAAMNVFSAYYFVVTGFTGGQLPDAESARSLLRELVAAQVRGFP